MHVGLLQFLRNVVTNIDRVPKTLAKDTTPYCVYLRMCVSLPMYLYVLHMYISDIC